MGEINWNMTNWIKLSNCIWINPWCFREPLEAQWESFRTSETPWKWCDRWQEESVEEEGFCRDSSESQNVVIFRKKPHRWHIQISTRSEFPVRFCGSHCTSDIDVGKSVTKLKINKLWAKLMFNRTPPSVQRLRPVYRSLWRKHETVPGGRIMYELCTEKILERVGRAQRRWRFHRGRCCDSTKCPRLFPERVVFGLDEMEFDVQRWKDQPKKVLWRRLEEGCC